MPAFIDELDEDSLALVDPETGAVVDTVESTGDRVVDVEPGVHRAIVECMDDIAFVVDEEWRLVYANPRARERTRASARELQGVSVTALTDELIATDADRQRFESALETVLAGENNQSPQVVEVELELPTGEAVFEYKLSSLPEGATNGAVVVARDVTERRDRERDLELMGELQSRVLRHNIRNDLNVVRGYAEMFAEEFDDEHAEMAETVVSTADDILSVSEKTRTIEELIQHDQSTETVDLAAMLRRVVDDYRRQFPAVSFALDCPRECRVETVQAVELALAEVIENAAEYGTAENPDVEIATTVEDDIVVTVSDNGPGIPQQELAIRDRGWETKLEHGAGIGLWIVEWLTEISEVAVRYDIGGEGTDVRLRIPGN